MSSTRPAFLNFETLMRSVAPRGGTAVARDARLDGKWLLRTPDLR